MHSNHVAQTCRGCNSVTICSFRCRFFPSEKKWRPALQKCLGLGQAGRQNRQSPRDRQRGGKAEGRTRFQNGLWVCTTSSFRAAKAGCHGRGTHNEEGQDKTTWKWPSTGESWMKPAGSEKRMSNSTRRRGTVGTAFSPKLFGSSALHELGRCGQKHVILGGGFTYILFSALRGEVS